MSDVTFPNGQTLSSSALTPDGIATVFQPIIMQILGITVDPQNEDAAYRQVRVGWQSDGQPASTIDEDVCCISATPFSHDFSKVRDGNINANDAQSVQQLSWFTQVWSIHLVLYGPNAYDHARLIVSAMSLDWVRQALQYPPESASELYAVLPWERPTYVPEDFQGQWWKRADVDLKFNELVKESINTPSAASATVAVVDSTGPIETITASL